MACARINALPFTDDLAYACDYRNISEHFSLAELTKTSHKTADGNIPSRVAIENLKNLCENWLVKGVATSNHLTGCAVDIHVDGKEQYARYQCILLDISDRTKRDLTSSRVCSRSAESMQASRCTRSPADFDELLYEEDRKGHFWLHFAVRPPSQQNRRKIVFLRA